MQISLSCHVDAHTDPLPPCSLCIVLRITKGKVEESERLNYVLMVAPTSKQGEITVYERIDFGLLPAKCLGPELPPIQIV